MLLNNRIIYKDNTTYTDQSAKLSSMGANEADIPVASATSAIYIGSDLRFNNRYLDFETANTNSVSLTVELWNGSAWVAAVDVIDQTEGLSGSHLISWVPDKDKSWSKESSTANISELSDFEIYDLYWAKITWDDDLSADTALNYVGFRFSDDFDLGSLYSELTLSSYLEQFKSGKTNWNEQHVKAAEEVIRELRAENIIWNENQIIQWDQFTDTCVHRVAKMAYREFGDDYKDDYTRAEQSAKKAFNIKQFIVDKDGDGRIDEDEKYQVARIHRG